MLSRTQSTAKPSTRSDEPYGFAGTSPTPLGSDDKPLWRQTVLVTNRSGREEAFTIGPDGCVWSFFPDALAQAFDAEYCLESLGMPADVLAVGKDESGGLVVVAACGLQVRYRMELPKAKDSVRWSAAREAVLPPMPGAIAVERLYTEDVFGSTHIAAIVSMDASNDESSVRLVYCSWTEERPVFFATNEARELARIGRLQSSH
jgi:hypothetical protein